MLSIYNSMVMERQKLESAALSGQGTLEEQLSAQEAYRQWAYDRGDRTLETHDARITNTRLQIERQKKPQAAFRSPESLLIGAKKKTGRKSLVINRANRSTGSSPTIGATAVTPTLI